ncbi:phosphatase PAP2 family protein [Tenacibaculum sp. SZ-18]|uniref:phosphatase PAP2 family protein n=1 Tax=Tenacibaculum sp. SZ-18 TaxID=754423 RepID=UPI000C2D4C49|nr:phosphatase PAP2 family protein [Tenacibaculum sp. SZ-18]AUC14325.1 phosphatase PAP2 family protein [Tenacibaculum sp. SZ-18]
MLDIIKSKDAELLIFLNNLGSEKWDAFWLTVTNQFNWIPLFVIILALIYIQFGLKKTLFSLLFIALMVTFSDQFTNLIKNTTGRIRPCNTVELQEYLRQFTYKPRGYSFWSGHASLSTTFTTFIILWLRRKFKFIFFLILFPLVFGYSRVYLGVHYPGDITVGYLSGIVLGTLFYKLYSLLYLKIFKENLVQSN